MKRFPHLMTIWTLILLLVGSLGGIALAAAPWVRYATGCGGGRGADVHVTGIEMTPTAAAMSGLAVLGLIILFGARDVGRRVVGIFLGTAGGIAATTAAWTATHFDDRLSELVAAMSACDKPWEAPAFAWLQLLTGAMVFTGGVLTVRLPTV